MSKYVMPYTVTQEELENTIMTALEHQIKNTQHKGDMETIALHNKTTYALGIYYREIAKRKNTAGMQQISKAI